MRRLVILVALLILLSSITPALAHVSGRGFILLLPTGLYIMGGAVVVAVSFLILALVPARFFAKLEKLQKTITHNHIARGSLSNAVSIASLVFVLFIIYAGYYGSRDPLANPLPIFVWSVWWIGSTYLHALFGNVWIHLNPWTGLYRLITSRPRLKRLDGIISYPAERVGYLPAIITFTAFAWFELVHPAPADPTLLANVALAYILYTFIFMFIFGEKSWLQYGETFSVFFRVISWLSPLRYSPQGSGSCKLCNPELGYLACYECASRPGSKAVRITFPSLNLLHVGCLSMSGVAFIVLALSTVSFDGLSRTFAWLSTIGVNPLEYPGRSLLITQNTVGLLLAFAALFAAYAATLILAKITLRIGIDTQRMLGFFIVSIVPIAFGYHFAHYLPSFMIDIQYALKVLSDPLGMGWDILGTRNMPVIVSFLSDPAQLYAIWHTQVLVIIAAHVVAVLIAHAIALRVVVGVKKAMLSQLSMLALMIGYTMFGLWLLSAPAIE
ncbi:MAG: hypothetical protein NXY59_08440 [Aigarchaeota archaeon]|nr:hypothetical protein [Candidatus Pelearchaeum maunauluense]